MQTKAKSETKQKPTNGTQSIPMSQNNRIVSRETHNLEKAIDYMNRLIAADVEYPETHWRASQCYPKFSADELQTAYDNQ